MDKAQYVFEKVAIWNPEQIAKFTEHYTKQLAGAAKGSKEYAHAEKRLGTLKTIATDDKYTSMLSRSPEQAKAIQQGKNTAIRKNVAARDEALNRVNGANNGLDPVAKAEKNLTVQKAYADSQNQTKTDFRNKQLTVPVKGNSNASGDLANLRSSMATVGTGKKYTAPQMWNKAEDYKFNQKPAAPSVDAGANAKAADKGIDQPDTTGAGAGAGDKSLWDKGKDKASKVWGMMKANPKKSIAIGAGGIGIGALGANAFSNNNNNN